MSLLVVDGVGPGVDEVNDVLKADDVDDGDAVVGVDEVDGDDEIDASLWQFEVDGFKFFIKFLLEFISHKIRKFNIQHD